jgi:drug/metabolite transporter (DMT)-like permease
MNWQLAAIGAYLLLGITNIGDKIILDKIVKSSRGYAFLISLSLGLVGIMLAPFLLSWPGWMLFWGNLGVSLLFPLALILFYYALKIGDSSRTVVINGGMVPIFTLLISLALGLETLYSAQWLAMISLIIGVIIMSWVQPERRFIHRILNLNTYHPLSAVALISSFTAAFFFALNIVGIKYLFIGQDFASALIWQAMGSLVVVLALLIHSPSRREILKVFPRIWHIQGFGLLLNQSFGAIAIVLRNYALMAGSAIVVSALQGVQYIFILILTVLISSFQPQLLQERISQRTIYQKLIAITFIGIGLFLFNWL